MMVANGNGRDNVLSYCGGSMPSLATSNGLDCHVLVTGSTVNFTGTVARHLLSRPKILAATLATSINTVFNAELRHLVETYEAAKAHSNQNFRTLLDFSHPLGSHW